MSAPGKPMAERSWPLRVAIVGGGLAGLATAVALADSRLQRESNGAALQIELFESRRMLGGRATSYRDPETGELIDNCQHVSLGCCTNFDGFCRRTGIDRLFETQTALNFLGPNGRAHLVRRSRWLPAPLHLAPSLLRLSYLALRERVAIADALRRLARCCAVSDAAARLTFGEWLRRDGQSERAIASFWSPVIVSALSEDVDRASYPVCRKVFVDAFLRHTNGYEMKVPKVALRTLYDEHIAGWLQQRGVRLHLGSDVRAVEAADNLASGLMLSDGSRRSFDVFVVAVPWYRVKELFEPGLAGRLPFLKTLKCLEDVPITSVHLWCNRKLKSLDQPTVLPGRFSQWIFNHTDRGATPYYQVVISASRQAAAMPRGEVIARVCSELEALSGQPASQIAGRTKVITEQRAVFSPTRQGEECRPPQRTAVSNLFLAGDWTATGWPATMEGAVRSGYLATEAVLQQLGTKEEILVPDLPTARLSRWLLGIR